jgi:hypothetical protein
VVAVTDGAIQREFAAMSRACAEGHAAHVGQRSGRHRHLVLISGTYLVSGVLLIIARLPPRAAMRSPSAAWPGMGIAAAASMSSGCHRPGMSASSATRVCAQVSGVPEKERAE